MGLGSRLLATLLGRPAPRVRRGPQRLALDVVAVERMTAQRRSARARLESELGRPLLRELERALELEGRLVEPRRRRRLRDAA
jgi:hypothetical protein